MLRLLAVSAMAVALLVTPTHQPPGWCPGLRKPVEGPILQGFAPIGRFSGHWGVDWGVDEGTDVRAAGSGTVTFAGSVAGNLAVTVTHGGGLRTSYSYLAAVLVRPGDRVTESTILGTSGSGHGSPVLHFSVRLGSVYLDPLPIVDCGLAAPSAALRLVPVRQLGLRA